MDDEYRSYLRVCNRCNRSFETLDSSENFCGKCAMIMEGRCLDCAKGELKWYEEDDEEYGKCKNCGSIFKRRDEG